VWRLIDYFSRAYVINLPARTDRRAEMVRELARAGMPLAPGRLEIFPAIRPPDAGEFPSVGARGCYLSHMEVLRTALRDNAARVLVMEDDLALSAGLAAAEQNLIATLSSVPWGLVYFGHVGGDIPATGEALVRSDERTLGAHFYGVSGAVLPGLVGHLEAILSRPAGHPDGGAMHFDGALATFRARNPGQTLFASPTLGWQRSSRSDIAAERWFDRLPFARVAVDGARRARNRWRRLINPAGG
jgi:hypothetical protein